MADMTREALQGQLTSWIDKRNTSLPGSERERRAEEEIRRIKQELEHLPKAETSEASDTKQGDDETGKTQIGDRVAGDKYEYHYYGNSPSSQVSPALQRSYLNRLLKKVDRIPLTEIDPKVSVSEMKAHLQLRAIYTALLTIGAEDKARHREKLFERNPEQARPISAVASLNAHTHLVLLGDPGSGKSTFVNFVVMCLAGSLLGDEHLDLKLMQAPLPDEQGQDEETPQAWEHGVLLPVRVILRDFAAQGLPPEGQKAGAQHLWEFIVRDLKEGMAEGFVPALKTHLRQHGGLLLLDGLDEVPDAEKRRPQIKAAIEDFAGVFSECRIVVTSRTYAYQRQDWRLAGFEETVLAPFSQGQILRFVERWYSYMQVVYGLSSDCAAERTQQLRRALLTPQLRSLAQRPLLLTLMASLHTRWGGELPSKRVKLYEETVELLLDRWEKYKFTDNIEYDSLSEWLKVDRDRIRELLDKLAYDAHAGQVEETGGTADISEQDLVSGLMRLSREQRVNPIHLEDHLRDRAGLLLPRGNGVYTFPHRTFQEYLAACHLFGHDDEFEETASLVRQEPNRWREVVLLMAARGERRDVWSLAEALCWTPVGKSQTPVEDAWGALLAGQALVEISNIKKISPRHKEKCRRIRDWLAAILSEQQPAEAPFPAVERALAGNMLAKLGDHRPGVGVGKDGLPDIMWCEVQAGEFIMGSNEYSAEKPQHRVVLSTSYNISRYPVTNAQYRAFVADGGYTQAWRKCWSDEGWTWKKKEAENGPEAAGAKFELWNQPVVTVCWYEAEAFCRWLSFRLREKGELSETQAIRLPTEAEWEKAARGEDERRFPWGNEEIDPEHANYDETKLNATSPVGCFPRGASPYGCEEMAGNVWEWCLDRCDRDKSYNVVTDTYTDGVVDPLCITGSYRVMRGGDWGNNAASCRSANRLLNDPGVRNDYIGFRLLRTPS